MTRRGRKGTGWRGRGFCKGRMDGEQRGLSMAWEEKVGDGKVWGREAGSGSEWGGRGSSR